MIRRAFVCCAAIFLLGACTDGTAPASEPEVANNEQVTGRGANKDNWWDKLPRPEWSAFERIEQEQDWFEVYLIAEDVYAIYEPGQFEEVMSFLIIGADNALLFDTGLGIGDMRQVVDELTDLDIIVLNSHTHFDHIGGNYQFENIYGRDTEFTRGRSLGSPPEEVADFLQDGWVWKPLPVGFAAEEYRSRPFSITRIVGEGAVID